MVGGFGVVANLPGTGSSEIPLELRQRLLQEAGIKGWGSMRLGTQGVTPAAFLNSPTTAVVRVEGLIPPGATRGTRFDVLVTALDQQTTSLEDGDLYTTSLGFGGANASVRFARKQAVARGKTYLNPFHEESDESGGPGSFGGDGFSESSWGSGSSGRGGTWNARRVIVLSGGEVVQPRKLELILNRPGWQMSRFIADRINERFPKAPQDRFDTAVAQTDLRIQLHVPDRFQSNPQEILSLISHLYLRREENFEPQQARRLADVLLAQPHMAHDIVMAWRALGKTVVPVLREFYGAERDVTVRLAALEAGAALGDETTVRFLRELASHPEPDVRRRCAGILRHRPRSIVGPAVLRELLDDQDVSVRITAYEVLVAISDQVVQRERMVSGGKVKFVLDLLPSKHPLIYISQVRQPRIVIFHKETGFNTPLLESVWDGRLRLRDQGGDELAVFYQRPGQVEGEVFSLRPTVANLVFLLGHRPDARNPTDGLDLSYSRAVSAVFQLSRKGVIPAAIELEPSPLAAMIIEAQKKPSDLVRPQTTNPRDQTGARRAAPTSPDPGSLVQRAR